MKIGFIGLGMMGESLSFNIMKKLNCDLYVFDVFKDKVNLLVSQGAIGCESSFEVAEKSDVIITMVPKNEHVIQIHNDLYKAVRKNQLYIDMSTISPNVSIELAKKIKDLGAKMIDAPVVKSKPAAVNGTLGVFVGGDYEDYERALPILKCVGQEITYLGKNGTGATMKLIHNMLVGIIQNGVNEMLLLAEEFNINPDDFVKAISSGGGQNLYLDKKGKNISERNFKTAFSLENMHKDMHLVEDLVKSKNLNLPSVKHIVDIFDQAMKNGYGKEDFSASFKVVEAISKKV